ncbi:MULTISPECIES: hypothetical protein [Methanothrix]|jgi:hypothetical protein|uniref:hypothetical protein n=1 Tax=Methanothrix TaxID=2222 RepID=UPI0023F437F7|nr:MULTISPECIES: hypothetical protein [Methanothrix]MDD5257310.1 hypothetical protein [Methanothrix soehngenii]HOE46107.1 hypothetical protein [Methanothrix soehngenii]HOS22804.1 hypothetical protein [Methanothrix soehngenii]HPL21887.1 hypothetical protein [Methanothrix soehngenii]HRW33411.1 hypothetical protein [Methanothrix sp.]
MIKISLIGVKCPLLPYNAGPGIEKPLGSGPSAGYQEGRSCRLPPAGHGGTIDPSDFISKDKRDEFIFLYLQFMR